MTRRAASGAGGAEPAGRLRAEHAEATRRAVLGAARSLFGRNGYAQTSVDEIADAARVTKGAVYHHFANKQALFRAVYAQTGADAQDRVIQAGGLAGAEAQPVDQIVAMMSAYLDASLDPEFRRIILIDGPAVVGFDAEAEAAAADEPGMQALRSFIAMSMAHGQLIELDPRQLTELIGGVAWLAGSIIARAADPEAARASLGRAVDAMLRGLAPDPGK
ncbi:MAG TPA: TetR family transcriptional regulator [Trebonia sp.]|nr:TetR family transcriptional regulator [Trebonia sp.]